MNAKPNAFTPGHSHKRSHDDSVKSKQDRSYNLFTAKVIQRPQLKFKLKPDNTEAPFVPLIKSKPHSVKPLAILAEKGEDGLIFYSHPYEIEIEKFEPRDDVLVLVETVRPKAIEETPFEYIASVDQLKNLVKKLEACTEIAVDLEHHSYRSYQGFTCLMQISTRSEDFVIDTLELRDEVQILNEIFANPKILKVFHGADSDIQWLQKDFGLYVVNMFDTFQASRILNLAHHSLAYLLKNYCNLNVDKQFQLADWRMRPLTADLLKYAREDTHYLLHVCDLMRNDLLAKGNMQPGLLRTVYERSKLVCLKRYQKPIVLEDSHLLLLSKTRQFSNFNNRQKAALKALWSWRDQIARAEDESIGYVLPNHMLLHIASALPREIQGILALCNPIPPLVKQQLNELHLIILRARELPLDKAAQSGKILTDDKPNIEKVDIFAKHDIIAVDNELTSYQPECLLDKIRSKLKTHRITNRISQFFSRRPTHSPSAVDSLFISPFERYASYLKEIESSAASSEEKPTGTSVKIEPTVQDFESIDIEDKLEENSVRDLISRNLKKAKTESQPPMEVEVVNARNIEPYQYKQADFNSLSKKPKNSPKPFDPFKQKQMKGSVSSNIMYSIYGD